MRLNYSDDEDFPCQFELWQANCRRSLRGKLGQRELRELEAALVALPEKRLIHGALKDEAGGMCAIAVYGKHKGVDLSKFDLDDSDQVGVAGGMPRLVAWSVVELNDITLDDRYMCGLRITYTPEERYEKVLHWVREQLRVPAGEA